MLKTEIISIVDRSGSMQTIMEATIAGANAFIAAQKEAGGEARQTFVQFDNIIETVFEAKSIYEVPQLTAATYVPRGNTALNDAIGRTLEAQIKRIQAEKWADMVIVDITTDGAENASRDYSADRVKGLIQACQAFGWQFMFQAANQDAFATASGYGIAKGGVSNMVADALGTGAVYGGKFMYANNLRATGASASLESITGTLDARTLKK